MTRSEILSCLPYILEGIPTTLFYAFCSFFIGGILGCALAFARQLNIRIISRIISIYVSIFRGTPLMLQLGIIYYGSYTIFGNGLEIWQAGILSFSLNSSAYISEIIRAGCNAVPKSQITAAETLGIPRILIIKDIILPQAIKNVFPALVNESIDLVKESTIISTIAGCDLMRRASIVASEYYSYFIPFLIVGAIYYIIVLLLSQVAKVAENAGYKRAVHQNK
jgi:His/Glu/Gln/Arg/opine family amino acid ABC transporter permease subunit